MKQSIRGLVLIFGFLWHGAAENKYGDHGIVLTARPFGNTDTYRQLVTIPETPRDIPNYVGRTFPGIQFSDVNMKLHACDVDYGMNLIYMYDYNYRTLMVGSNFSTSMRKEDMNFTIEHYGISQEYVKVAVDWISHNVYWTDSVMGSIVMQPGGQNVNQTLYKVIVNKDLDLPRGIAVDPISGFLFWTDFSINPKIERASLIGENRQLLVSSALYLPDAVTADHNSQRIYFTNSQAIESVKYDGTDRKPLVMNRFAYFFDIAIYKDVVMATDIQSPQKLYFYDTSTGKEAIPKEDGDDEVFYGVCMYHKDNQPSVTEDRCSTAGCEDICVDEPGKAEPTCLCRTGFELNADRRTCKFIGGQYYRAVILNNGTHLCLLDIRILSDHHNHRVNCFYQHNDPTESITYIEINSRTREVYFSTEKAIYRVPIDQENAQSVKLTETLPNTKGNGMVTGLSYDYVSGHLYWSEVNPDALFVMNPDSPASEFLQLTTDLHNITYPRAVLVLPHERQLLWLSGDHTVEDVIIQRTDLGASAPVQTISLSELPTNIYLYNPTHMLNHVKDEKLYILDAGWSEILVFTYNGSYETDYNTDDAKDFALYNDYILVAKHDENNNTALFSADLGFGPPFQVVGDGVIEDIGIVVSLKIMDKDVLQTSYPNPCRDLNGKAGGCDHICIALSGQAVCRCDTGFTLNVDGKSCDSTPVVDNFILALDTTHSKIHQIPLDQPDVINGISTVSQTSLTGVFFNYLTQKVILGSQESDQVWSVNIDGTNETMLTDVSAYTGSPKRFALDPSTGNLYFTADSHWSWLFEDYSLVGVISPRGYTTQVIEGGHYLGDIVLHPEKGYMFWADYGSSPMINRASMDGSNLVVIASGPEVKLPKGLAIDYTESLLYWTDDMNKKIYKSDLDGNNIVTFLEETGDFGDVRIVGDYVYYTVKDHVQVTRVHKHNTSDVMKFGSTSGVGVLEALDVYISSEVTKIPKHNVCSSNNGGCSHFCLPNEAGGRSCGCEKYYNLLIDGKTCENAGCPQYVRNAYINTDCLRLPGEKCGFTCFGNLRPKENKLLTCQSNLTWDDYVPCRESTYQNKYGDYGVVLTARGFNLDDFRQVVAIPTVPRQIPNYPSRTFPGFRFDDIKKKLHACEVDYHKNMIYMYDYQYRSIIVGDNFSMSVNLDAMNFTTEHYGVSREFVKIAVDWISHNIYWTDTVMGAIMMQPGTQYISPTLYKIVIQDHLDLPRGIAVDPLAGYLFWTDISTNSKIERSSLLGENRRVLPINALYIPDAIAADHTTKRIYFANYNSIESATYDGLERTHLVKNSQAYFFDIAVFGNVIMATDISKYYVHFYDAVTGEEVIDKEGSSKEGYFGICMYHENAQPQTSQELCVNAGCEDICVEEPNAVKATCVCRTGSELQSDGICKEVAGQYQRAVLLNNGTHLCLLDIRILSDHHDHQVNCFYQHTQENETMTYVDVNMKSREVYFSTMKSIYRVPINIGSSDIKASQLIRTPGDEDSGHITGLSYDWINNHLYWSQTGPDGVFLINPNDPQEFNQIATKDDTYSPRGVLVVPHANQLFWIASNGSATNISFIEYGNLGLSRGMQMIVPTSDGDLRTPTHLLHDNKRDLLYILDIGWKFILRATYNGTLNDYFSIGDAKDFALYNDYLLVMEHDKDKNTQLYSGDIGLGSPLTVTADGKVDDIGTVISMKIIDVNVLQKTYPSPCGEKDGTYGGCEQICIPVDNKPTCRCDTGFVLNEDGKSCDSSPVKDDFILVTDSLHAKLYQVPLNKPEEFHGIKVPNKDNPSGILYNYITNKIVFGSGDSSQIWDVNIDGTNATFIADIDEWYGTPTHIALDPSTGNMFITAFSYYADYFQDSFIAVVSPSGGVGILYDQGHYLGDIVLHSGKGYMFWTDHGTPPMVNRAGMDGSDVTVLTEDVSYPAGLAIDYEADELYWQDSLFHKIYKSDLDGNNIMIFHEDTNYMVDIRLFGDSVYYTGLDNMHLTKLNKYDTTQETRIGPKSGVGTFGTLDIYSSSLVSQIPVNNACSKDNGNCSHFCLPNGRGGRTCGCEGYYELLSDGMTCENAPRCQGKITGGTIDKNCHRLAGQQCDFTCDSGFRRKEGVLKLLCQGTDDQDLSWDVEAPCEEIFCPVVIPNGQLQENCSLKFGASCGAYSCNQGYEKNKAITSFNCTEEGTWDIDLGMLCNEKCPELSFERDMVALKDSCKRDPEEMCGYTCKQNYKPVSNLTSIKCLSGSQWNVVPSRLCTEILCQDYIPNGLVHRNCSLKVDSMCTFSCANRFTHNEKVSEIRCLSSGDWNKVADKTQLCIAIPPSPPQAARQSEDVAIGLGVGIGVLVLIIIVIFVVIMLYRMGKLPGRKTGGGSGSAFENPRYQESSFDAPPGATGESNKSFNYATLEEDKLELTDESWRNTQSHTPENTYDNHPATLPASAVNPSF